MPIMNQLLIIQSKMNFNENRRVLYDVSPHEFKILDDDHVYEMGSKINHSLSSSSHHNLWSTVAESGLITQQVSL